MIRAEFELHVAPNAHGVTMQLKPFISYAIVFALYS